MSEDKEKQIESTSICKTKSRESEGGIMKCYPIHGCSQCLSGEICRIIDHKTGSGIAKQGIWCEELRKLIPHPTDQKPFYKNCPLKDIIG